MSHTITAKLNSAARSHQNQAGTTFFVSLGEKNYNYKTKTNEWTNYEAALFAKDKQIDFYSEALVEGAILTVTGSGIIIDDSNKDYKPKLVLQDAKLEFVSSQSQGQQRQAPPQQRQAAPRTNQSAQAPNTSPDFDFDDDIPFS